MKLSEARQAKIELHMLHPQTPLSLFFFHGFTLAYLCLEYINSLNSSLGQRSSILLPLEMPS